MDFLSASDLGAYAGMPLFWIGTIVFFIVSATLARVLSNTFPGKRPPVWEGTPFIGGILKFLGGPLKLVDSGHKKFGEVFTVPVFHKNITFLIGPAVSKHFFSASDDEMSLEEVYGFNVPTFGKGVVYDVDKKIRAEQFRMLGNALKTDNLKNYLPLFQLEVNDFFNHWAAEGVIDFTNKMSVLTTYTASRTLLGREVRENIFEEVSKLLHDLDAGMIPISVFFPYLPIPCHKQRDRAREKFGKIFSKVVASRRESGIKENDLLQIFIDAHYQKYDNGRQLNSQEITGLLIAALFAGQHTSSITSAWTGLFLAKNKEWWKKCEEEQKQIISKYGDELSYEIINEMTVLHCCIQEALRINPPLVLLFRYAKKSFSVTTSDGKQFVIPKGHIVGSSPVYAGRLEHTFKDPSKYDPSRFMDPREEDKKTPMGYLPFGSGRHSCMGHNFAYLQIKTLFSHLIRNFEIEMVSEFPEPDYDAMVVGAKPSQMKYKRRLLV